jgi:hypothetical protein
MSNEIDLLMDLDPTEMSAKDIDAIIGYMRYQRANFEKGIKPKKVEGPKKTVSLASLGLSKKAAEPAPAPLKRRGF